MPVPTCEITKKPFKETGERAPLVLPCRHVFSEEGIKQLIEQKRGAEGCCPRCGTGIPKGVVGKLPRHSKICALVKLLNSHRTDPSRLQVRFSDEAKVDVVGGHTVYSGSLLTNNSPPAYRAVHVKVIPLSERTSATAWRELTMLLQVTQSLGKCIMRTLGYVEVPGHSLQIILEPSQGSIATLVKEGKADTEFGVRLAEWTASTLAALHSIHVLHAAICPTALRLAPPSTASPAHDPHRYPPANGGLSSPNHQDLRVMISDFSAARALTAPEYIVASSDVAELPPGGAAQFAAPERMQPSKTLRKQSDMWSYGATMYYVLTGISPPPPSQYGTFSVHAEGPPEGPQAHAEELASGAPPEVFEILKQCMHEDAQKRPSAGSVAHKLSFCSVGSSRAAST